MKTSKTEYYELPKIRTVRRRIRRIAKRNAFMKNFRVRVILRVNDEDILKVRRIKGRIQWRRN